MNTNSLIKRVQKSTFGKAICRLVGEESGQAMMEYVLIAVLIAAASAVAIWYFGRGIQGEAAVATNAAVANNTGATDLQKKIQGKVLGAIEESSVQAKNKINTPKKDLLDSK